MAFWSNWFKETKKLTVEFTKEEWRLVRWWADQRGVSVAKVVQASVLCSMPVEAKVRFNRLVKQKETEDSMFARLDEELAAYEENPGLPPVEVPSDVPDNPHETHPCQFAAKHRGGSMYEGAQAMCWHPDQRGRPCHWAASFYESCPLGTSNEDP